jgi:hypothetical protein
MKWLLNRYSVSYGITVAVIFVFTTLSRDDSWVDLKDVWSVFLSVLCIVLAGKIFFDKCNILPYWRFFTASALYFMIFFPMLAVILSSIAWGITGKTRAVQIFAINVGLAREHELTENERLKESIIDGFVIYSYRNMIIGHDPDRGVTVLLEKNSGNGKQFKCTVLPKKYSFNACS